jgi:hypothetical protein
MVMRDKYLIEVKKVSILLLATLITLSLPSISESSQCTGSVCIDVHTDPATGKVVIDATKIIPGSTPKPTPVHKSHPTIAPKPKPTVKRTINPTPRPYVRHVPYVYHPPKPKPAKTISPAKSVAAVNLADQITALLPLRNIYIEPAQGAVAQIPTYFWTDTNSLFSTSTIILGVAVGVTLNPTFTWDFGDGSTMSSNSPGAPLPDTSISHIFKKGGSYIVTLRVSWLGTWAAGAYTYPVLGGAIVQSYSTKIVVAPAPTFYNH